MKCYIKHPTRTGYIIGADGDYFQVIVKGVVEKIHNSYVFDNEEYTSQPAIQKFSQAKICFIENYIVVAQEKFTPPLTWGYEIHGEKSAIVYSGDQLINRFATEKQAMASARQRIKKWKM